MQRTGDPSKYVLTCNLLIKTCDLRMSLLNIAFVFRRMNKKSMIHYA